MTEAPAKPAQPTIADLYAEIAALRKENERQRQVIDGLLNREKAEAFNPKLPSIHDHNATLTAQALEDGVTVRANRHGWIATSLESGAQFKVERDASPYSNYQAAAVKLAGAGIYLCEPQLVPTETPATVLTPTPTPA
jgi:hypothetical protein